MQHAKRAKVEMLAVLNQHGSRMRCASDELEKRMKRQNVDEFRISRGIMNPGAMANSKPRLSQLDLPLLVARNTDQPDVLPTEVLILAQSSLDLFLQSHAVCIRR